MTIPESCQVVLTPKFVCGYRIGLLLFELLFQFLFQSTFEKRIKKLESIRSLNFKICLCLIHV